MRIVVPCLTLSQSAKPSGAKRTMVEPCSNQPISSPLENRASHGITLRPAWRASLSRSRKAELDAGDKNRGDRHQRYGVPTRGKPGLQYSAFIPAKEFIDAFEGTRIDVPGIARNVGDLFDPAIMRGAA